jgi:predicted homoserine dehydrogenase-like protein
VEALPIGLSEGCVLRRNISKDDVLSFNDVDAPVGRKVESLWREQNARWLLPARPQAALRQPVPAEEAP